MNRKTVWSTFVFLVVVIFATLPLMRDVVNTAKDWEILSVLSLGANGVGLCVVVWIVWNIRSDMTAFNYGVVGILLTLTGVGVYMVKWPSEQVHFVEYGLLGAVAYLGLRIDLGDWQSLVASVLLVALVGYLDEVMQYYLPRRHFGWHDVLINAYSGVLGALMLHWGLPGIRATGGEHAT